MRLGIMQPYFFPYIGYFDLINCTDRWIVFDTVQYIRHGWINRNRILHPIEGWQYIIVPLKGHSRDIAIKDVEITEDDFWRRRIEGQLYHYKNKAPYFIETCKLVEDCLRSGERLISRLNVEILKRVCRYLGIRFEYDFFSEMNLEIPPIEEPGDWALRICAAVGANEYVNPPGGLSIFDPEKFNKLGIRLTIRTLVPLQYSCIGFTFVPGLSIIDVLMWKSPQEIMEYLNKNRETDETDYLVQKN